jgi:phosphoglycolate phosphatase
MMTKPELILIDVDGTLVDSVPDLAYCIDEMMKQLDMPVRGIDAVREWVGNGVETLTKRALVNALSGEPDAGLFAKAMPIFNALYAVNNSQRSNLYPGVLETLEAFKADPDYRVGCVTNKAARFTIPILEDLGIKDFFEIIVCGDTLEKKKPDPLPLLHVAEKLGIKPENALMLGDSMSDVKAARAAGFKIVCMSYGYNHGEDIRDYNPDAVIDTMTEFSGLIKQT